MTPCASRKVSSKKASTYLEATHKDLQFIFSKVKKLNALEAALSRYLEPSIANKCTVANSAGSVLTLVAANGSIATLLRYQATDLLKKFKQDPLLQHITELQCKVHPASKNPLFDETTPTHEVALLSNETAAMIEHTAEAIEHPKLKAAMKKIAGRTCNRR